MALDKEKLCKELKVIKRIQETSDSVSLILEVPRTTNAQYSYKAGQFMTLFLDFNGEEIRRSYSLASSPDCDTEFKLTIKAVPGGKASNFLVSQVNPGDKLWATPPAGHFCLPAKTKAETLIFYAAGSGITPIFSILKSALKVTAAKCILLYQNRDQESIIFKNDIESLKQKFPNKFSCEHILSQPQAGWPSHTGRIDKKFINTVFSQANVGTNTLHFMCGPEGFMKTVESSLHELNVKKENILKESFATAVTISTAQTPTPESITKNSPIPPAEAANQNTNDNNSPSKNSEKFEIDEDAVLIGDPDQLSTPETLEVTLEGEKHVLPYKRDKTVLECLLEADLNPPYSCLDGACMACIAKVQDGLVYQDDMGILTEDNLETKECLTCQARPASKVVKVIYEIF